MTNRFGRSQKPEARSQRSKARAGELITHWTTGQLTCDLRLVPAITCVCYTCFGMSFAAVDWTLAAPFDFKEFHNPLSLQTTSSSRLNPAVSRVALALRHDYSYASHCITSSQYLRCKHDGLLDKTKSIIKGLPNPLIREFSLKWAPTLSRRASICASSWRSCLCLCGLCRDCSIFLKLRDFGVRHYCREGD